MYRQSIVQIVFHLETWSGCVVYRKGDCHLPLFLTLALYVPRSALSVSPGYQQHLSLPRLFLALSH